MNHMETGSSPWRRRGSILLMAVIVLAVLAVAGAGTLLIATRERTGAAAKGRHDMMRACGEAASRRIWAEVALNQGDVVGAVWAPKIPGGPRLGFGHYDQDFTSVTVNAADRLRVRQEVAAVAAGGGITDVDTANTFRSGLGGQNLSRYFAHCVDTTGRQYEVEMFARFGL